MKKPIPLLPKCLDPNYVARFWQKVDVRGEDECWPWIGDEKFTGKNYGTLKLGRKVVTASRVAFSISTGIDPLENLVLHSCDNRPCCNPKHMHEGTPKIQVVNMVARGRWRTGNQKGSANATSKLTETDIPNIRARIAKGETNVCIAKDYGVTHHIISKIRLCQIWQHVMEAA